MTAPITAPITAQCRMLADGKRLHCNHGPIDLIIEADGKPGEVSVAYDAARSRFASVLDELADELPELRTEARAAPLTINGKIAVEMAKAVQPFWRERITPMAAVAGAVADEILRAMAEVASLRRAYVNNGGDIALHLAQGEVFAIASPSGRLVVRPEDGIGGIATSGWQGRSFSLGIADAVTVLAATAAKADAVATMIANAVDLPASAKVKRQRACEITPDSDLGARLVTVDVAALSAAEKSSALALGAAYARNLLQAGLIKAASLQVQGQTAYVAAETSMVLHG